MAGWQTQHVRWFIVVLLVSAVVSSCGGGVSDETSWAEEERTAILARLLELEAEVGAVPRPRSGDGELEVLRARVEELEAARAAVPATTTTSSVPATTTTSSVPATTTTSSAPSSSAAYLANRYGDSVWKVSAAGCGSGATGSAFAIGPRHLVTNAHVVATDGTPTVTSRTGVVLEGRVVGASKLPDLSVTLTAVDVAVIEVQEVVGRPLEWAVTGSLTEGQSLLVLGYPTPHGEFAVNPGVITSFVTERTVRRGIRTDADIDPGYSGGPALTDDGEVAGVLTLIEFGTYRDEAQLLTADSLQTLVDEILSEKPGHQSDCGVSTNGGGPYSTPFKTTLKGLDHLVLDDSTAPAVALIEVSPSVASIGDTVTVTWRVTDDTAVNLHNYWAILPRGCEFGSGELAAAAGFGGALFTPAEIVDGERAFGIADLSVSPPPICASETPKSEGGLRDKTLVVELTVPAGAVGYYGLNVIGYDDELRLRTNFYMNQLLVLAD